jgi:hypothetical protein
LTPKHNSGSLTGVADRRTDRQLAAELSTAVEQLAEEVRILRMAVDELRDDVVWAARQVLAAGYDVARERPPKPVDPLAPDAVGPISRMEPHALAGESAYCCESPHLAWHGSPDAPGIMCTNCGYLIAEEGNLLIWRDEEEAADTATSPSQHQHDLFD